MQPDSDPYAGTTETAPCDHCGEMVTPDQNGYYVGADDTSDCRTDEDGHAVEGKTRA